ncbi:hypothetical protein P280DRAFT_474221 [Massarina eburnea CBS 473.64]|uniref:Pentatricopeptide repeat protein n=1 Tax=Massarina eburnea CBS 473.64 TaxID=1395130 RepID=A0A6A6RIS5_9PLEO|nr:hypothetical protein P280DRAFT_474221 [Massarina eburnea CBS 473.64]
MLSFLSRRSIQSPLRILRMHERSLNTFPSPTSVHIVCWNPLEHTRFRVSEPSPGSQSASQDAIEHDARKVEREHLRDRQGVTIPRESNYERSAFQRHAIEQLNTLLCLADAGDGNGSGETSDLSSGIWKAYCSAKRSVPGLLSEIPDRGWDVLWATQTSSDSLSRTRGMNLDKLRDDMGTVGKLSTVGMRVAYLEDLFMHGGEEQALKEWEEDYAGAGPRLRQDYKPEHLELGAKLYALDGKADRAREIMDELFELYPLWNPSVMMHVFRVHTDTDSVQHRTTAWKIYTKMRELMLQSLTLDHYDAWFVGFLESQNVRYAQLVFRDMIKGGFLATSLSPNDVDKTLKRFHLLSRTGTDIDKMTRICLQAITLLPPAYHLYIFGHWMGTAVKWKAPGVATQIIEMIFTRGYRPTTTHFNLLLKALFRTKELQQITKAENIGWRMIEATRVALPGARINKTTARSIYNAEIPKPTFNKDVDQEASQKVPQADVTTFAIIMQHHGDRDQWEFVDYLLRRLKESNTRPNARLMNVLINNASRKGSFSEVWKIYKSLTDATDGLPGVFPDGASIRLIWRALRLALSNEATRDDINLPTPRQLLAETIEWWKRCRGRHDAESYRTGLAGDDKTAIIKLVIHCFSYTQDLAGSLVALHVLRQHFYIFPTDEIAEILQKQAAWVDMGHEAPSVRLQYNLSKMNEETLVRLARIWDILVEQRQQRLGHTGDKQQYAHLSDKEIGDLGLDLLSEFVRVIMKRTYEPAVVEEMIQQAKEELGVPDMSTGDLNAFEVA